MIAFKDAFGLCDYCDGVPDPTGLAASGPSVQTRGLRMVNSVARGACLCGAVRFSATLPSKWVAHGHGSFCRRADGPV